MAFRMYFQITLRWRSHLEQCMAVSPALPGASGVQSAPSWRRALPTKAKWRGTSTNLRISASVNPSTRSLRTLRGRPLRFGFLSSSESSVSLSEAEDLWACLLDSASESLSFVWAWKGKDALEHMPGLRGLSTKTRLSWFFRTQSSHRIRQVHFHWEIRRQMSCNEDLTGMSRF